MKRVALVLVLALAFSCTVSFLPVNANFYQDYKKIPPPSDYEDPTIAIESPSENAAYSGGNVTLSFSVTYNPSQPKYICSVGWIDYQGDWMQSAKRVYDVQQNYGADYFPTAPILGLRSGGSIVNLTGVPDGKRSITVSVWGGGHYVDGAVYTSFNRTCFSTVNFTMDTVPSVSLLSFENSTFTNSSVPLVFNVDQPVVELTYCLDDGEKVKIGGNTTLSGVPNGNHSVIVYATDEFGTISGQWRL